MEHRIPFIVRYSKQNTLNVDIPLQFNDINSFKTSLCNNLNIDNNVNISLNARHGFEIEDSSNKTAKFSTDNSFRYSIFTIFIKTSDETGIKNQDTTPLPFNLIEQLKESIEYLQLNSVFLCIGVNDNVEDLLMNNFSALFELNSIIAPKFTQLFKPLNYLIFKKEKEYLNGFITLTEYKKNRSSNEDVIEEYVDITRLFRTSISILNIRDIPINISKINYQTFSNAEYDETQWHKESLFFDCIVDNVFSKTFKEEDVQTVIINNFEDPMEGTILIVVTYKIKGITVLKNILYPTTHYTVEMFKFLIDNMKNKLKEGVIFKIKNQDIYTDFFKKISPLH